MLSGQNSAVVSLTMSLQGWPGQWCLSLHRSLPWSSRDTADEVGPLIGLIRASLHVGAIECHLGPGDDQRPGTKDEWRVAAWKIGRYYPKHSRTY